MNVHAGVGAGKLRQPYRIREFLAEKGLTMAAVALEIGVNSSTVSYTVRGSKNNKRVLDYLHSLGCPAKYLSMPKQTM